MSKIFSSLRGIPLTKEEDELLNRWKYLQKHSRDIVMNAIAMAQGDSDARAKMLDAVANYLRLGGKAEDIKYYL